MSSKARSIGDLELLDGGGDSGDSGGGTGESGGGDSFSGGDSGDAGDGTAVSFGGDSGGGGGNRAGTGGGKQRGRPRKDRELVREVPGPTLTEPEGKNRSKSPDFKVLIDTTIVGLFGLVATATAHEHWLKERDDVLPITGPLKAWVEQLPPKTLKAMEKRMAPTLFVIGCAVVVGPDVVMEMRTRKREQDTRRSLSGQGKPSFFRPG